MSENKISIEALNIKCYYAIHKLNNEDDKCPLCRGELRKPPPDDIAAGILTVSISYSNCKHVAHTKCIAALQRGGGYCPIDNTPWVTSNVIII